MRVRHNAMRNLVSYYEPDFNVLKHAYFTCSILSSVPSTTKINVYTHNDTLQLLMCIPVDIHYCSYHLLPATQFFKLTSETFMFARYFLLVSTVPIRFSLLHDISSEDPILTVADFKAFFFGEVPIDLWSTRSCFSID